MRDTQERVRVVLVSPGDVARERAIFEPLLVDRERVIGPEPPDTLHTRASIARTYEAAGRSGEAIAVYEALLADRERILGLDHPDTLDTRNSLAVGYRAAGRPPGAERILNRTGPAQP